jgi:hypothetical protein
MRRFALVLALATFAACGGSSPEPAEPAGPAEPAVTEDARLAACERDEWVYCWMRDRDGSIPGSAMARYRAGCSAGRADDCMRVAVFTEDLENRPGLYQRACDGGIAQGCEARAGAWAALAHARQDPQQRAELFAKAFALYEQGCTGGDAGACSSLAIAYAVGDGVAADPDRARAYAGRTCDLLREPGCALAVQVECTLGGPCPEGTARLPRP